MVLLSRIYTRAGDQGKTSLGTGERVKKSDPRIDMIGSIDELNAALGVAMLYLEEKEAQQIAEIQNDLFDVGADLCMPLSEETQSALRISSEHIIKLEQAIDLLNKTLEPLTSFVLPGGSTASAYIHLARTICRRVERVLCTTMDIMPHNPCVNQYINRLSDYLFVLARFLNDEGKSDVLWVPGKNLS
ncbi:MAG: cob(I)yrinic acid a,c-diamide adenosyltransferase [Caedimonadaceae bacterium]|nr:MAG: cob(I)yrinic acid a,c-diamide adenosyltransferase [Caedimonadaceae bacterium]